jgi:pimeloyl-ACP methyl ester carboxylesterase
MSSRLKLASGSLFLILASGLVSTAIAQVPRDPASEDPTGVDRQNPPAAEELKMPSGDTRVNALLYRAQGKGPHPVVILLHGFPGNERNLDLGQALRRAGYHVLYFNYRGSWGSGGSFSFGSARQDVAAAFRYLRSADTVKRFGIDPGRIVLVGHSLGGWLALAGAADDREVRCTVALAPWNVGRFGALLRDGSVKPEMFLAEWRSYTDPEAGPLRGTTAEALAEETKSHAAEWDLSALAAALSAKHGLVIASTKDEARSPAMLREPLDAALRGLRAEHWQSRTIDDDHSFSAHRIALARTVIGWLQQECDAPPSQHPK